MAPSIRVSEITAFSIELRWQARANAGSPFKEFTLRTGKEAADEKAHERHRRALGENRIYWETQVDAATRIFTFTGLSCGTSYWISIFGVTDKDGDVARTVNKTIGSGSRQH